MGSGAVVDVIYVAAANGDIALVEQMLSANPSLLNAPDASGATPLHWAVDRGQAAVVECLLAHKADVNARKKNGVTALQIAAGAGYTGIARQLIASGADVSAKDSYGRTALSIARGRRRSAVVSLLTSHDGAVPEVRAGLCRWSTSGPEFGVTRLTSCYINLDDPAVKLDAAIAQHGIGHSETFGSFMKRLKPTAAINGTFFGVKNQKPIGDIVISGRLVHFGRDRGRCLHSSRQESQFYQRSARQAQGLECIQNGCVRWAEADS